MTASPEPTAVIERWLALVADPQASAEDVAPLLHPSARFVEHPNLVNPRGKDRGVEEAVAGLAGSRSLLAHADLEVVDHLVAGERVVTRAVWTATLAIEAGPLPAGTTLRADCSMHFVVRDGRIVRQENFDCYAPPATP